MSWAHACVCIRLSGPFHGTHWRLVQGDSEDIDAKAVESADFVVMHREFPAMSSNYGKILWKCRMEQKPVIYELDDLLTKIPKEHSSFEFLNSLSPSIVTALEDADAVIVSTEKLKSALTRYNKNIFVVHNHLNDDIWQIRSPRQNPEKLVIGYAASVTHRADAELLGPVLADLADHLRDRINIEFVGVAPPAVLQGKPNVFWHEMHDIDYLDYVRIMNEKAFDIAVAPLVDNEFNRCKSALKYLEFSAMGAAGVYAKLDPYGSVISHGENGFLAGSPDDWTEYLKLLVEKPGLRTSMAAKAQKNVCDTFLLGPKRNAILDMWLASAQ